MKDIYNKVKYDMTNKPEEPKNDLIVIKTPWNENQNDVLDKLKSSGVMSIRLLKDDSKPECHKPVTSVQFDNIKQIKLKL